jgi:hypothetical protein
VRDQDLHLEAHHAGCFFLVAVHHRRLAAEAAVGIDEYKIIGN